MIERLEKRLREKGVRFLLGAKVEDVKPETRELKISLAGWSSKFNYRHLFNTTGLQADRIAREYGVGEKSTLLPFKGIYWQLHPKAPFHFDTNLYPVPDLNVPFLGVHITPSPDGTVSLGPSAIPAWGRENYRGERVGARDGLEFLKILASQWWGNSAVFEVCSRAGSAWAKALVRRAARQLCLAFRASTCS